MLKNRYKWTKIQEKRAEILFREYPDLEQAYEINIISMKLTTIYNQRISPRLAMTKLNKWHAEVEKLNKNNYLTK